MLTRRGFLSVGIPAAIAAGSFALGIRSVASDTQQLELKKVAVPVTNLPADFDGFTIAQLSDFHYHPVFTAKLIANSVGLVNKLHPDLVSLTGDFVTMPHFSPGRKAEAAILAKAQPCGEVLRGLRAKHGIFAVLGNHDQASQPDLVAQSLDAHGIRVLRNEAVPIELNGGRIWIGGVKDVLEGGADLDRVLQDIPQKETVILLSHEPDFADVVARYPVSVQLSGHSHGGQVRIPFVGAPYLPHLGRKYPWGLRQIGSLSLYTNSGLGTIEVPFRWNCPPEVTLVVLRRRQDQSRALSLPH